LAFVSRESLDRDGRIKKGQKMTKLLASILLAVSLSACLEMPPTQIAPEQALRECQASNPYSEGQEYVDYERDCYSKYNEAKGLPR
jgi:hypothetical protein